MLSLSASILSRNVRTSTLMSGRPCARVQRPPRVERYALPWSSIDAVLRPILCPRLVVMSSAVDRQFKRGQLPELGLIARRAACREVVPYDSRVRGLGLGRSRGRMQPKSYRERRGRGTGRRPPAVTLTRRCIGGSRRHRETLRPALRHVNESPATRNFRECRPRFIRATRSDVGEVLSLS